MLDRVCADIGNTYIMQEYSAVLSCILCVHFVSTEVLDRNGVCA
jgi:hypothetical protein